MKKIIFEHDTLEFDEWLEPGYTAPNRVVSVSPENINAENSEKRDNRLFFQSFGSGSSGNCCYVGNSTGGILIDAGVRDDVVVSMLRSNGISMEKVRGILLTHDHADHIKYAYKLIRNHKHIKLFCSNRVINGMLKHHGVSSRIKDYHIPVFKEIPFKITEFEVTAFEVIHDSSDCMGFSIDFMGRKFVLATDVGTVTARARHYISEANYVVVESNFDRKMLINGRYPEYLKYRIMHGSGHLDNELTAKLVAELYHPAMSHIFLCHLSEENNTPEIARSAVKNALENIGKTVGTGEETMEDKSADVQLIVLPRKEPTRWYVFR